MFLFLKLSNLICITLIWSKWLTTVQDFSGIFFFILRNQCYTIVINFPVPSTVVGPGPKAALVAGLAANPILRLVMFEFNTLSWNGKRQVYSNLVIVLYVTKYIFPFSFLRETMAAQKTKNKHGNMHFGLRCFVRQVNIYLGVLFEPTHCCVLRWTYCIMYR